MRKIKQFYVFLLFFSLSIVSWGRAIIDPDVLEKMSSAHPLRQGAALTDYVPVIIFLDATANTDHYVEQLKTLRNISATALHFMPAVIALLPRHAHILYATANDAMARQISSFQPHSVEELEVSAQSMLLTSSNTYPNINNWWSQGYIGQNGVIGLLDSGVDVTHPGLLKKNIIVRQEAGSQYDLYKNGVRTAHGTGAACIYSSDNDAFSTREKGIAYGAPTIVTALAGEGLPGQQEEAIFLTLTSLDWMLTRAPVRPTIINYSFGHEIIGETQHTDWSGLAKIVDYVVNHEKILWVKSAGNQGYVFPSTQAPFHSTMTVPADNYNALTVANMNPTILHDGVFEQTPDRQAHSIRFTSSRGPTLAGRRKPDLTAPGNDTRTCAPDPLLYSFHYTSSMDYHDGYRLMGGTSSAAPHVGGAVLLLQDAGIKNPMAAKALLINSADAWVDSGQAGPDDPQYIYFNGHYPVQGSAWNPTYGWGYINMQQAFDQRTHLIEGELTVDSPTQTYEVFLPVGGKVTLVHERRVGYFDNQQPWRLSHLALELVDANTQEVIDRDDSAIDTVHQVSNCHRVDGAHLCDPQTHKIRALVRVTLISTNVDGSVTEPFVLSFG